MTKKIGGSIVASCYPWLHRVVTIRAITVKYWHSIYFIQTHILAMRWFNIQRLQVDPIDFRHQSRAVPTPFYECYWSRSHSFSATHCHPGVLSDLFLGQCHHLPELLPLGLHLIY